MNTGFLICVGPDDEDETLEDILQEDDGDDDELDDFDDADEVDDEE